MDAIAEWNRAYERVRDLVSEVSPEQAETMVPACPAWTVRQLLSHMIGLDADVVRGDEPDDHNERWTQAQVAAREDSSVDELLEEWAGLVEPLRAWMEEHGTRPLGDVVIHEQDLRGALGVSGAQDTEGLAALRDRMAGGFASRVEALPPIALVGDGWAWTSAASPGDAETVLEASTFDLTRALMSRRSADQLRSWTTRGDVTAYLEAFAGLGPLPTADLTE